MNTGNPYVCDQEKLYHVDSIPQGIKRITHYVKKNGKESTFNNRKYYVDIDNGKVYRHHGTILFTCHPFTNTKATVIIDDNKMEAIIVFDLPDSIAVRHGGDFIGKPIRFE